MRVARLDSESIVVKKGMVWCERCGCEGAFRDTEDDNWRTLRKSSSWAGANFAVSFCGKCDLERFDRDTRFWSGWS